MKSGIHPHYDYVVFRDRSANHTFLTRSTMSSAKWVDWPDGKRYPLIDVDISDASHPFWTGKHRVMDTQGRVEKFRRKYGGVKPAPNDS